jgi:hypothetical protein
MAAKIKALDSGDLRHVGNLEQRITGTDDTGAPSVSYDIFAAGVRFAIDDWKPTEAFQAQAVSGQLSTRLVIRYRPGMEGVAPNQMRMAHITNPGASPVIVDYYEILGAVRDYTMRTQLILTCTRRDAAGFRTGATP